MEFSKHMALFTLIVIVFLVSSVTVPSLMSSSSAVNLPNGFDATVAKDNSGDYTSISDAIAAAPNNLPGDKHYYIRIKPGVYNEHVEVLPSKRYIALFGDDAATTKITDNRSNSTGYSIEDSGTLNVHGTGFMAWNLTIENSAGEIHHQAVALNSDADYTSFYKCVFLGYQDTLLANTGIQFYKECDIYGTVDFIFGYAKAVFQDCRIFGRRTGNVLLTAQGKDIATESSGFSFQNCYVTVAPELEKSKANVRVYLGRPWKNYATVIFMESFLDNVVQPEGWLNWDNKTELVFLAEYGNYGPGANTNGRVKWHGVHVFTTPEQAMPFTVAEYIDGNAWLPDSGILFRSGLKNFVA